MEVSATVSIERTLIYYNNNNNNNPIVKLYLLLYEIFVALAGNNSIWMNAEN